VILCQKTRVTGVPHCMNGLGNSQIEKIGVKIGICVSYSLIGTALLPHGISFAQPGIHIASFDHAMWFYRECNFDDWFLFAMDCPNAS